MLKDLIMKNRSYRRFQENKPVSVEDLKEMVELARCSASGGNVQPLKFMLSCDAETNGKIFPHLAWAGGLPDWDGPAEGKRPAAYIIILGDKDISSGFGVNHGIAAQSICLGAAEKGLGGCMLGSIKRENVREELAIPEQYEILLIIALGKPSEKVVIDDLEPEGDTTYWRDDDDVHHVPKRTLDELIIS
jgi:nitroreductase